MTPGAIFMMILVLSLVWGGFIYTVRLAIKSEKQKKG